MRRRPVLIVVLLASLWASWFCLSAWLRHSNFFSSHFDLGIMDQTLWQTVQGNVFQMTSPTLGFLQSRLAIHGDLLLLVYTPFYALWQDPRTLVTLQILAVASGVLPLWWLARRQLTVFLAVLLAALYLLQPVMQWSILFDVHAVVLATPLLLWGVWAAVTKRHFVMWLLFGAALLAKEEVGLVVAGVAVILQWRQIIAPRVAWILGGVSLGWVLIMTGLIIPLFAQNQSHFAINYFSEYGDSVPRIIVGIIQHPIIFWNDLINWISLGYVAILIGSVAFLPLRKPVWLFAATPILVMNVISNDEHMQSLYYQYTATITPFVLLATIDGLASLQNRVKSTHLLVWIGIWGSAMVWLWAPLPGMRHHRDAVRVFQTHPYVEHIHGLVRDIPPDLQLAVSNDLGPHFSRRERIWVFPFALERADAVVVLLNRERDVLPQGEIQSALNKLRDDDNWEVVQSWNNELFYLRRVVLR